MMLVSEFFFIKNGRKACVRAAMLKKLTLISELNFARSTFSGLEKS